MRALLIFIFLFGCWNTKYVKVPGPEVIKKEKITVHIKCLLEPYPRPPKMFCQVGNAKCPFKEIDIALRSDYSRKLERWAQSAEALCGVKE